MRDQKSMFEEQLALSAQTVSDQRTNFDARLAKVVKDASAQQTSFDSHMAKALEDASHQQRNFDSRIARAALDANDMKEAYERLSHDNAFQRESEAAAAKVWPQTLMGPRHKRGPRYELYLLMGILLSVYSILTICPCVYVHFICCVPLLPHFC